jgi:hypothetical protein
MGAPILSSLHASLIVSSGIRTNRNHRRTRAEAASPRRRVGIPRSSIGSGISGKIGSVAYECLRPQSGAFFGINIAQIITSLRHFSFGEIGFVVHY